VGGVLAVNRASSSDVQRRLSTLGKVMVDPGTPSATKVRAADSILNHTIKAIETENLEARLSELERAEESRQKK
jgi:hypothetical protein